MDDLPDMVTESYRREDKWKGLGLDRYSDGTNFSRREVIGIRGVDHRVSGDVGPRTTEKVEREPTNIQDWSGIMDLVRPRVCGGVGSSMTRERDLTRRGGYGFYEKREWMNHPGKSRSSRSGTSLGETVGYFSK